MRFDELPESLTDRLPRILASRLAVYRAYGFDRSDFFLQESCRSWEGLVESQKIVKREDSGILWHHQLSLARGKVPTFTAVTREQGGRLRFQEINPCKLAQVFHETIGWLDDEMGNGTTSGGIPQDLPSADAIVRLLTIRRSFFHGLSFHVEDQLPYVLPLVFPQYFEDEGMLEPRTFVKPDELARVLSEAPSFLGVR